MGPRGEQRCGDPHVNERVDQSGYQSFKGNFNLRDSSATINPSTVHCLGSPLIAGSTSVRAGSRSRLLHPSRAAASGMDLRCTAWDSYADKFESFLITRPYKEVNICILRVWRIDRELGSGEFIFRAVNNMSELLFNPPVVEAINAKHKMLLNPAFQCTEDGYNGDL
ncbi:hypothetical protein F2Q69_00015182 [Brassica cretica]|uniref:DUF223 domain-containing protein n=1 Tax=Brassica cretica TaxID=69181 RepID=A0A8S9QRW7_BRACR|nr:hypothetical protein F2Q69_00015182 [Brassica cretica]